jgi:hypothetical protein
MDFYVRFALATQLPLSEVMTWEPEALQTGITWLDEKRDAMKAAARKQQG